MKTPQKIYNKYHISAFEDIFEHNIGVLNAMKEFGKQCFEAARKENHDDDPYSFDLMIPKYNSFEDYLNKLNDE